MGSTKHVLDRHLRSFGEHDLKGILSDYAPGASCSRRRDHSGASMRSKRSSRRCLRSLENLSNLQP